MTSYSIRRQGYIQAYTFGLSINEILKLEKERRRTAAPCEVLSVLKSHKLYVTLRSTKRLL